MIETAAINGVAEVFSTATLLKTSVPLPAASLVSSFFSLPTRPSVRGAAAPGGQSYVDPSFRKSREAPLPPEMVGTRIAVYEKVCQYARANTSLERGPIPLSAQLLIYEAGDFLEWHYDSATSQDRHLTSLLYLNDGYIGGEISFPGLRWSSHPRAGTLLIFPSDRRFAHRVQEVTSGVRYVFQSFWTLNH